MTTAKLKDRIGPFTAVPNRFIQDATISHEAFRLFVVLRQHTNTVRADDQAFPGYAALKTETGIKHNKTIANSLRELETKGWLERRKRFGKSTIYTLTTPDFVPSMSQDDLLAERHSMSPDDISVCHGVTSQYVIPSHTNKTNKTRRTKQDEHNIAAFAAIPTSPNESNLETSEPDKDEPATPPRPATPKEKQTKATTSTSKASPLYGDLFRGLARLTQFDTSAPAIAGRVGRAAKFLDAKVAAGLTLEQVDLFAEWWRKFDWRGKQNQPPTPEQVCESWGRFFVWQRDGKPEPQSTQRIYAQAEPESRLGKGLDF